MPTNVTVEYAKTEQEYKNAKTTGEKIKALQNMWREAPKHKGGENLRKDIRTKLAKFKEKLKKETEKKKGKALTIKKEGNATIVLVGPTNSGKSLLLRKLTGRKVAVADYDFTTKMPEVGVMNYKGVKMQIIELPAITPGYFYREKGPQFFSIIRNADIVVIVTDTDNLDYLFEEFNNAEIKLNEKVLDEDFISLKAIIAINKQDLDDFNDVYVGLCKYYNLDLAPISALTGGGLELLKDIIWKNLGLIKVYTKEPGKNAKKDEPLCLKKNATIEDMAVHIHKDFIRKFRFSRVWGKSAKFGGQMRGLKHILEDEDIVEIHLK